MSVCYANSTVNNLSESGLQHIMKYYNKQDGLWHNADCIKQSSCVRYNGYWYFANIYKLLISHQAVTNDKKFERFILNDMQKSKRYFVGGPYFDDELWWVLAYIDAYKLTNNPKFLKVSEEVMADVTHRAPQKICQGSGGIYWNSKKTQVGSIANELYILASAKLYQVTKNNKYKEIANSTWKWFTQSGLIGESYVIYDHYQIVNKKCGELYKWEFTYTNMLLISSLANLSIINNDKKQMNLAIKLARQSMFQFSKGGVLTENCTDIVNCAEDGFMFKGVYVHELSDMAILTHNKQFMHEVRNYLQGNYNSLIQHQGLTNHYAYDWSLAIDLDPKSKTYNPYDLVTITSAVYLLNSITKLDNAIKLVH